MTAGPGDGAGPAHDPAVASVIDALHTWAEGIRRQELSRAEGRWEALSDGDRRRIDALTRTIVGGLLGEPAARLRAGTAGAEESVQSARYLFGLEG
jgi:glutamyl-tRNA reductase